MIELISGIKYDVHCDMNNTEIIASYSKNDHFLTKQVYPRILDKEEINDKIADLCEIINPVYNY